MRPFIKKTVLFLVILFLMDRCFIVFKTNETNIFAEFAVKKMQRISSVYVSDRAFDIWVVGSSHAQFAVSPDIINKETGKNSLNIAFGGGANMGLQLTLLKNILEKNKRVRPKLIAFGIDVFTMNAEPEYNSELLEILMQKKKSMRDLFHSKVFYSYCRLYGPNIPEYLSHVKKNQWQLPVFSNKNNYDLSMFAHFEKIEIADLGWVKGYGILNKNFLRYSKMVFKPDPHSEKDLAEYIRLCRENNIRLVFFQVPENMSCLVYSKKYDDFRSYFQKITKTNEVDYFDYNSLDKYPLQNDSLFFDSDHLNVSGAELFTQRLAKDIARLNQLKGFL